MSITLVIIIITIAITLYAWNNPEITSKLIFSPYKVIHHGEIHRLLSSGFLHTNPERGGYFHLGLNMYALYLFGESLEYYLNEYSFISNPNRELLIPLSYIGCYILGIIAANLPSLIKHKDNYNYFALGASGGVSSIVFATMAFAPTSGIGLLFIPVGAPGFIFAVLYLIYSYHMSKKSNSIIGHEAHFAGAVFGFLFTVFFIPEAWSFFKYGISHWDGKLLIWM